MKNSQTFQFLASVCLLMAITVLSCQGALTEVTAEGRALGDMANAREQALTDALREAVRKGAGVDVLSQTDVRDFVMEYDRIFAAAFGYVKNYTILGSGLGNDGFYRVTVRAQVGEGQPGMKDVLALKMLVNLKQSPRVAVEIDELIEGVPVGSDFAKAWFESAAREMQMNLVDVKRMTHQSDRLAARDAFFGDQRTAEMRRADFTQKADFIIQAKVRGNYVGPKNLYGLAGHEFAMAVDVRAIWPDTGAVIVSVPMPTKQMWSQLEAPAAAARDIVHRLLAGSLKDDYPGAYVAFRKMFAHWITELDLGTIMKLEFNQMTDAEHDQIIKALGTTEKITSVWPREFDNKGLTFVDVESRLDATGVKSAIQKIFGTTYGFDHATRHYLQFKRVGSNQPSVVSGQLPSGGESQPRTDNRELRTENSIPPWAWVFIGAGGVAVLFGIYSFGKRAGKK